VEVLQPSVRATLLRMTGMQDDQPPSLPSRTVPVTGFAHVRLTVTDLARSRAFYDAVFGWDVAFEVPPDADEQTRQSLGFLFGGVIYSFPGGLFGLRPVAPGSDTFSEDRVGLDHLSLQVRSRADLDAAATMLDALGASHGPVKDLGALSILEFRDPDGIALELSAADG
jgi:glyoxylase I family protein